MKTAEKLKILAEAAKYDASCSSSGSSRKAVTDGIGNAAMSGICHSWAADGRCVSLFKILMSNDCVYDCSYCLSRRSNTLERATFTPEEIADLTINFYLRNYIEGLFLSSAVYASPDKTMADLVEVCRLLRNKHKFNGYIHLKVIPGASNDLVQAAGFLADRMSVNIELPSEASLNRLAPQKSKKGILAPMKQIGENFTGFKLERKKSRNAPSFCPAGQTTQMIIGASAESDFQILNLTENLYNKMSLKRVYYSAYIAVNEGPLLPAIATAPPLVREHRLYQADWLLRFYKFQSHEILSPAFPHLDERLDPKAAWALRNFDLFPIDINSASYEELLRIPGVGVTSARRIIQTRRVSAIREQDLKKIGMVLKRARFFISINGKYLGDRSLSHHHLVNAMCKAEPPGSKKLLYRSRQLPLF
jgi:putative DNA modification/repair radical SAM protein